MSNPYPIGAVDLESVLNVRRRTLASIDEISLPHHQYRHTETVYIKRESKSNSLLSIDSNIYIFGEIKFLCHLFEPYKSNIIMHDTTKESDSDEKKSPDISKENEPKNEDDKTNVPIEHESSTSSPAMGSSPTGHRTMSISTHLSVASTIAGDCPRKSLEGKRYGCIEIPNMTLIEILEIILHSGLELTHESNNYDAENVLHQSFIFLKAQKSWHPLFSRSPLYLGT